MYMVLIATLTATIIPPLVFIMAWILSNRSNTNREKASPFECGFDPIHSARIPFSMRFFLLAVIFLVFDIEIVLLMPMPMLSTHNSNIYTTSYTVMVFLMILMLGLLHEWKEGSLNWSN